MLSEENIKEAVKKVRLALLDADVNYSIVSALIKKIKEKVVGETAAKSVSAGDHFVKVVHEELVALMGEEEPTLAIDRNPGVIMLCGLQGAGKTTQAAKLALYLKNQGKKVLLAACDLQRMAAVEQLQTLGAQVDVDVYVGEKSPPKVAKEALKRASIEAYDVLIVDTAGRLHLDEALMGELLEMKKVLSPHEILFVANSATGQDAVKIAAEFDQQIGMTGTILTMLDGSSRAGAAISIREVTGKPLKFEGVGEKMEDIQLFNAHSMADRILGMGDIINLVKRAEARMGEVEDEKLEKKLRKASFTYQDYLKQMGMMKKMGSLKSMLKMMPGVPKEMGDLDLSDKEFVRMEAMILSMTMDEREGRVDLEMPRRRRIALGSGVHLDDVNRMVKGFKRVKQFLKKMGSKNKILSKLTKGSV